MKYLFMITFTMLALSAGIASCSADNPAPTPETEQPITPEPPERPGSNDTLNSGGNNNNNDNNMRNKLRITTNSVSFTITLEDNAAVKSFKTLLPMTVDMSELNGNEKYHYLTERLPTATSNPSTIQAGDLMLFGSSCIVLFYKTFSNSYSYTRLGRMDNASGVASALGTGNVSVIFELQ